MQPAGRRGIRSSKGSSSRTGSRNWAVHSDRERPERPEAPRHLGYGAGDDGDGKPNFVDDSKIVHHSRSPGGRYCRG
jgi:hypothetical protein